MTLEECTALLAPFAVALGARLDVPTYRAYHKALANIPAPLFDAALDLALRHHREPYAPTFPPAPRLRAWAEQARVALQAAHQYRMCEACRFTGWLPHDVDGVERVVRCDCWRAHRAHLVEIGVGGPPLLDAAKERTGELEAFDPRMAQLGADQ